MEWTETAHGIAKNRRPGPVLPECWTSSVSQSLPVSARLINVESGPGEEGRELKNETNTEV